MSKKENNKIPDGWKMTTLGAVADINAVSIGKNFFQEYIEYIDIASVENREIKQTQSLRLSEAPSRAKRFVRDNDVLISTVRPNLKHYCFVKNSKSNLVASTGFAVISAKHSDPKFLYYLLTTDDYTNYLTKIADNHTSAYPAFNADVIADSIFALPPPIEQRAIAAVLSSFDDKIELLRAQNKTLEATAQAIFKEWFINFNFPDQNGKPYKDAGGRMVNSELGEIPSGWKVGKLGCLTNHIKISSKPSEFPHSYFYHYSIPSFDHNETPDVVFGSEILSNKYQVVDNCFLVSKLNPRTPRIWTVFKTRANSICSTEFQVIKPKQILFFSIVSSILCSEDFTKQLASKAKGTSSSHQRANPMDILDYKLVMPKSEIVTRLNNIIFQMLLKADQNNSQIQTLATLRNKLLPKLMKGKIRT